MLAAYEASKGYPGEQTVLTDEILKCISWLPAEDKQAFIGIGSLMCSGAEFYVTAQAITEYFLRQGRTYKDDQMPIITGDGNRIGDVLLRERGACLRIILDNLRSVFNVGSIFRTSECLAVSKLCLCGTTPTPAHPNMAKTAMGTCDIVPWAHYQDTKDAIRACKSDGYRVLALETAQDAISVFDGRFDLPIALVLGNESLGISPEILEMCDACVDIPVMGWKNSLNVGVAFAIAAYTIVCGQTGTDEQNLLLNGDI